MGTVLANEPGVDVPRPRRRRIPGGVWLVGLGAITLLSTAFALEGGAEGLPRVAERSVRIRAVQRGPLVRGVAGHGTLVPERVRWLTADTAARVEQRQVEPGARVEADTVVVVLSNADLELQALEARSELAAARAELADLEAGLETDRLGQKVTVARVRADQREAERTAEASEKLEVSAAVSRHEVLRARDHADALTSRLSLERKRLGVLSKARTARVAAQQARVDQLAAVVAFRDRQLTRLAVVAGEAGVMGEIPVQVGQWVEPGTVLGRVVQPDRLEARLRIPEVRARDLRLGQAAQIDTHMGQIAGHVSRIDAAVTEGTVVVDVALDEPAPTGARPDQRVDGEIEVQRLPDVLWVDRPAGIEPGATVGLYVVDDEGVAQRVSVTLGGASTHAIEVVEGLALGDRVIVSDVGAWSRYDRFEVE